jgi:hypothetical protein
MSPALLALAFVIPTTMRASRTDREWLRLLPALHAVWQEAWYCARCGGAFLDRSSTPDGHESPLVDPERFQDLILWAGSQRHQMIDTARAGRP